MIFVEQDRMRAEIRAKLMGSAGVAPRGNGSSNKRAMAAHYQKSESRLVRRIGSKQLKEKGIIATDGPRGENK